MTPACATAAGTATRTAHPLAVSAEPDAKRPAEHDPGLLDPEPIPLGDRVVDQWCPQGFHEVPAVGPYVEGTSTLEGLLSRDGLQAVKWRGHKTLWRADPVSVRGKPGSPTT